MKLLTLAACTSGVAYGQNQAKMLELHNQVSIQEPLDYATAQQLIENEAGAPDFLEYTLPPGVVLGGLDGGNPFFIQSQNMACRATERQSACGRLAILC
jgi:hypothetical protein